LTPQKLEERKEKGVCFNCDSKYSKGHKCGENKLFYIDCEEEEEEEEEQEPSQDENVEEISSKELNPTISCNALARISVYYLGWLSLMSTLEESLVANSDSTKVWVMDPSLFDG
jgi:hypothetical protein